MTTENILGYNVEARTKHACVNEIFSTIQTSETPSWLACLNPHSYTVALNDPAFSRSLKSADWLVPDGIGVVYASALSKGSISDRITGADIFFGLIEKMEEHKDLSVFFLGSTEETLEIIRSKFAKDYPNIDLVGTYSPPFKAEYSERELSDMVEAVNLVKPDVIWIGMTAPKQEKWIHDNLSRLDVKFAGAIGAVFDFYAGKVTRSPLIFQKLGLEWLPRLIQQPRRLWRRMFVSAPIFIWHAFRQKFKQDNG